MAALRSWIVCRFYFVRATVVIRAVSGWVRAVGIVGLLAGGVAFMKIFFVPSVVAIYLGLVLLFLDVCFERLSALGKAAIFAVLVGFGICVTHYVVLRKSPLQLQYSVYANAIDLVFRNDSFTDDYDDLDLTITISPSPASVFVGETQFMAANPNCYFVREPGLIPNGHSSVVEPIPGSAIDWPDLVRVRCSKVPRQTAVKMRAMTYRQGAKEMISSPPYAAPLAQGQFSNPFRAVKINQKLELVGSP